MELKYVYFILLSMSIFFLFAQLLVKKKRAVHIVFAIFCGSMAMVAAKQIGADMLNPYHYLIGLGTCATCNAFWLVSRGLFRTHKAIETRHVIVAVIIAGLIMFSQMLQMADALTNEVSPSREMLANAIGTLTEFLSSTILTLTFWEALRSYSSSTGSARHQRTIFMLAFSSAIIMCMFVAQVLLSDAQFATLFPWFTAISAIVLLSVTQGILLWQGFESKAAERNSAESHATENKHAKSARVNLVHNECSPQLNAETASLISDIRTFVEFDKGYLQSNLKMKDLATQFDMPEYRISRAIRQYLDAENFNQYINELRIKHAKNLLADPQNSHWTVLVIALESGFSSVVSFNRVFKSACKCTPSEYRNKYLNIPELTPKLATG